MQIFTMNQLVFISNFKHENLEISPIRHWGGPIAPPYHGYSLRHLNQHGPMREVKDMTMEEIRKLEVKYGAPIRVRITLRPDTMMIK